MPIPPNPALDETISVGQTGHIADHQAIADTLNDLTGQAVGQQGLQSAITSAATMAAAGNRAGWTYWATDSKILWRFDGTNWRIVAGSVGAKMRRAAALSPSSGVGTAVVMDTDVEDPCNVTGLGTFRDSGNFKVPTVTGLVLSGMYAFSAGASWALHSTGSREIWVNHSASGIIGSSRINPGASQYARHTVSGTARVSSGQTLQMLVEQTSGGALAVDIFSGYSPALSVWRIGD